MKERMVSFYHNHYYCCCDCGFYCYYCCISVYLCVSVFLPLDYYELRICYYSTIFNVLSFLFNTPITIAVGGLSWPLLLLFVLGYVCYYGMAVCYWALLMYCCFCLLLMFSLVYIDLHASY